MEATEEAILGLIKTYCECPVDSTNFHNSSSSCSNGTVTFSSILAHASDDGSVTATVIIETFEAALSKDINPTITVDGQELVVYVPADDDSNKHTYTTDRALQQNFTSDDSNKHTYTTDRPVQRTCTTDDNNKHPITTVVLYTGWPAAILVSMVISIIIVW